MATKKTKIAGSPRKARRTPVKLTLAPGSKEFLAQRMGSAEGKNAIQRLSSIIVESFVKHLSREEAELLSTPKGQKAFIDLWPEIVDAFLHGSPAIGKPKSRKTAAKVKRRSKESPDKS